MRRQLIRTATLASLLCALLTLLPAALVAAQPHVQGEGPTAERRGPDLPTQPFEGGDLSEEAGLAALQAAAGHPKLDSTLNRLAEAAAQGGALADVAETNGARLAGDRVQVQITVDPARAAAARAAVAAQGGEVTGALSDQSLLQAFVPTNALAALADSPDLAYLAVPEYVSTDEELVPDVGGFNTSGVTAMNAGGWHAAGYRGAGVKVAIIDGGFIGYNNAIATGDLPANITAVSFADGQGPATDTEHGTACAEIVYDIAPNATLYIIKVGTVVDLNEAVTYAISQGVRVISTSINWFNEGSGDGTGLLPAEVNRATNAGIIWLTSTGNYRNLHYSSNFVSADNDSWHDFAPGLEINCFAPTAGGNCYSIPAGEQIRVYLRWADWTAPVDQNYDLLIYRYNGSSWLEFAKSQNVQNGGAGQRPTEAVSFTTSGASTSYGIVLRRTSATQTAVNLDVFTRSYPLRYRTPERSIGNIAPANNVVAVAALDVNAPYPLESYSSAGPRNGPGGVIGGGSTKPDIAGFANVNTQSYGTVNKFNGTSSATPHVAGAAALIRGAFPSYNVGDTREFLRSRAVDMGAAGMDTSFGWGRVWLGAPPTGFSPRRRFDFNANQRSDILWRHAGTGNVAIWFMNAGTVVSAPGVGSANLSWKIVGSGDFNGDNRADILWRNSASGANAVWLMNGSTIVTNAGIIGVGDLNWKVAGTGDFNGDNRSDIIWRHALSGEVKIWFMNGTAVVNNPSIGTPSTNWKIIGSGDFNGDNRADILWRNSVSGGNSIWFMSGSTVLSSPAISSVPDLAWKIAGVGDFNADKKSDILWRKDGTGDTAVWTMNGATVASNVGIGSVPTSWKVVHNGDFNGDNRADILWRNSVSGANSIWFMSGTSVVGKPAISAVADLNWQMVGNPEAGSGANAGPYVVADGADDGMALASDGAAVEAPVIDDELLEVAEIGAPGQEMETSPAVTGDDLPGAGEGPGAAPTATTTVYLPMLFQD